MAEDAVERFIARWERAEAHERANYQMFLTELCDLLDAPHPDPSGANNASNAYVFDRAITRVKPDASSTTVYADLYKRGCFILETKQGANAKKDDAARISLLNEGPAKFGHGVRGGRQWDIALEKAYNQARGYIRDLPAEEGRPPFLVVCDVGYVIELYSEFTCTGGTCVRFPDPKNHRVYLDDLRRPEIRERLKTVWTNPDSLDPSKHAARVTREVAWHLSELARSLEADGHKPQPIATFLQRCLFTLFAEDTGLLPEGAFLDLLKTTSEHPEGFIPLINRLWKDMAVGTDFSTVLMQKIAHFNGGLFENASALPLNAQQIALLMGAARPDWSDVEPAIFGTLLERALEPHERHKLGAHYTPRSYVERLVKPTIIDPLRARWDAVKTAAAQFHEKSDTAKAVAELREFHHYLCKVRVLDPACGSGNFLYVTLEHMKRLEGEVLELLEAIGDTELTFEMQTFKVRPQQFYGLEINERAVAIAQLVLWIGYFQWHKKSTGITDTGDRPLLPKEQTIRCQDAVLAYDEKTPRKDSNGNFVTIWDGRTTKPDPITGMEVRDESTQIPVYDYINPRRPEWPDADFIIGNPPFIGDKRMISVLGESYTETLRAVWKKDVPESSDFVMYWWEKAAQLLRAGKAQRFGFITTNSIHQTFNRRVLERHLTASKQPLILAFAIPDHPWVDSADGADVRIAVTVATCDPVVGELNKVTNEVEDEDGEHNVELEAHLGTISSRLRIGVDTTTAIKLKQGFGLNSNGMMLGNKEFKFSKEQARKLGWSEKDDSKSRIKPILNGHALSRGRSREYVLDLFGLTPDEVRRDHPEAYQYVVTVIKPKRDTNNRKSIRERWWLFAEPRKRLRAAIRDLARYIVTIETSRHRYFCFHSSSIVPEHKLVCVGLNDGFHLGILSSLVHLLWVSANQSRLGVGNDPVYVQTTCFETFPFPDLEENKPLNSRIRELGEQLDAHRKRQQAAHADLTMTGMYNVLEKIRKDEPLNTKERKIHDDGLVTVLKQTHDELDAAVLAAYGWQDLVAETPLADRLARGDEELEQEILTRLVALNHERAAEEKRGLIRWLRPDYQNPEGTKPEAPTEQGELAVAEIAAAVATKQKWPATLPDQVAAIRALLPTTGPDPAALAAHFGKRTKKRLTEIQQILATLQNLGQL